ncbi:MAG: acetylornithine/N-succinyldiaminopimelate aminotransferase [Eubacteriales bacterium]|nr:acetylornithine/N-succinyldiaminopimelate aminotransferase [Eubacteriales bacterium]MDN5363235.1 acetylornithine/N-succinyldiaminopimelate aminotransferase [Eubacteriales bacterium]
MSRQKELIEQGQKYLMNNVGRLPLCLVRGEGPYVWDADGKKYLDFVGGLAVNAFGHCPPFLVEAMLEQARRLIHVSNLYWIEPQIELARLLVENSALDKAFFCNSGAEANEAAIKLARKYAKEKYGPEKYEIITMTDSFHGRTLATVAATAQPRFHRGFEPLPPGFKYVPFNDFKALKEAVTPATCAVMLEPVQGEGGVNVADPGYLREVAAFCREKGLLLIFDEVQCGMGRTGKLFAYEHYGVVPDILTLAKALGGGFPIGATLAREEVAAAFRPGDHSSTFGGNPLACAVAVAAVRAIVGGLAEKAAVTGAYFREKLAELAAKYPFVKEVRGLGLLLGMELDRPGAGVVARCQEEGLLINCTKEKVLRFLPPLNIEKSLVDEAVAILDRALAAEE